MNRRYGNSSSHMRSHMLALCVTTENDFNPASLHLVNLRAPGQICVFPVVINLGNERFNVGTILSVAGAFPMSGGARALEGKVRSLSTLTFT